MAKYPELMTDDEYRESIRKMFADCDTRSCGRCAFHKREIDGRCYADIAFEGWRKLLNAKGIEPTWEEE